MGVGNNINTERGRWEFTDQVVENFDQHVELSVPGYLDGHNIIVSHNLGQGVNNSSPTITHALQVGGYRVSDKIVSKSNDSSQNNESARID